ncbi:hypothetical protein GCM10023232_26090 [Sphingosinicella ginsenosidimutans]|nr:pilus assembly protein [Sphingosinicella ginsenosidimutans]
MARALAASTSGLAMLEFAFALPVLLTLSLVGIEVSHFAMANLRVSNIAVMTADNAARVRDTIDETDVVELMTGAKMTGGEIDFGRHGRIILSSIEANTAGAGGASTGQWIRWQRCDGAKHASSVWGTEGKGQNDATLPHVGSPNTIDAAPGTAVMLVEVFYDYQPLIPNSILSGRTIHYESAFNVRQRTNQAIANASSLSNAQKRLCSNYDA